MIPLQLFIGALLLRRGCLVRLPSPSLSAFVGWWGLRGDDRGIDKQYSKHASHHIHSKSDKKLPLFHSTFLELGGYYFIVCTLSSCRLQFSLIFNFEQSQKCKGNSLQIANILVTIGFKTKCSAYSSLDICYRWPMDKQNISNLSLQILCNSKL